MSAHKLYMAMKNMLSMAIPGYNWTDELGEQLLADSHAACKEYEDRVANALDWPGVPDALKRLHSAHRKASTGKWEACAEDGMLDIPGHDSVEFDDADNAEFCAVAHADMGEVIRYLNDLYDKIEALRADNICQRDAVAKRDQELAATHYIISRLDDIIWAVKNPEGLRLIAEMYARQEAERAKQFAELCIFTIMDDPKGRELVTAAMKKIKEGRNG